MSDLLSPAELVRVYGLPAKRALGQNFLTDVAVLDRVVQSARLPDRGRVLEIGPGPGGLTSRLLAAGHEVHAVEPDRDLVAHLESVFAGHAGFRVTHGSALDEGMESLLEGIDGVVANLPYNVASPILFRLLDAPHPPKRMALMFQREVAERIVCTGPARSFGSLGVACNIRYDTRISVRLKPGAFQPPPKVESAVVRLLQRDEARCDAEVESLARQTARIAFGYRRKMLRKTLLPLFADPPAALERLGLAPTARPEELSVDQFIELGRILVESST